MEAEVEEEEKCVGIDDNIAWGTGAEDGVEEGEGDGDTQ